MRHFLLRTVPLFKALSLAAMAVIAWESLQPTTGVATIAHFDKLMHFVAYAGLAGLLRLGWPRSWGGTVVAVAIGFGILIEILQGTMALGRTASLADGLANTAGAFLAVILLHFILRRPSAS